jgi:hypothetical protein
MHYEFDLEGQFKYTPRGDDAVTEMGKLGIYYQHASAHSLGPFWIFWNCEKVPATLPKYITPHKGNPMSLVGHGLTVEQAEKITTREKEIGE